MFNVTIKDSIDKNKCINACNFNYINIRNKYIDNRK